MSGHNAELLSQLNPKILVVLLQSRASIDDAFASIAESKISRHMETMLAHMQRHLLQPKIHSIGEPVSQWTASLLSLGLSPSSVMRAQVSLGDLIVQVAKDSLPVQMQNNLFIRELVRLNYLIAKEIVQIFRRELQTQSHSLSHV